MTRQTVGAYFTALRHGKEWQELLADDMTFTSHTSPLRELRGRAAFVAGTAGFYGSIRSFTVRDLVVDGDRAVAMTTYQLQIGDRPEFSSDVAELFRVRDDKIVSFEIYFDTAPYPR